MTPEISTDWLGKATQLFSEFGPFFVSVLIMVLFLPPASKALAEAEKSQKPADVRFRRQIYVGIWGFAGFLILVSVAWWLWIKQVRGHVVRFEIADAQPTDVFAPDSDELYYRSRDVSDPDRRRDIFIAVSEEPFRVNQELFIVHTKGIDGVKGLKYPLVLDEDVLRERRASYRLFLKDGKYGLQQVRIGGHKRTDGQVISFAFAGEGRVIQGREWQANPRSQREPADRLSPLPPLPPSADAVNAAAQLLLDEKASLSTQLGALESLNAAGAAKRPIDLLQPRKGQGAGDESLLSYLLTLAKHEDRLVSYKAKEVLDKFDYVGAMTKVATGESSAPPAIQRRALAAASSKDWELIEARAHAAPGGGRSLKVDMAADKGGSPVPSAAIEGTQYWGRTTWQKLPDGQKRCLASLVYRQNYLPLAEPSDAQGFVDSRDSFVFVFPTKSEAVVHADASSKCGAKTEFLYKSDKRLIDKEEDLRPTSRR